MQVVGNLLPREPLKAPYSKPAEPEPRPRFISKRGPSPITGPRQYYIQRHVTTRVHRCFIAIGLGASFDAHVSRSMGDDPTPEIFAISQGSQTQILKCMQRHHQSITLEDKSPMHPAPMLERRPFDEFHSPKIFQLELLQFPDPAGRPFCFPDDLSDDRGAGMETVVQWQELGRLDSQNSRL